MKAQQHGVESMESSIVSYPDRGKWGRSSWRGNCSGHLYADLFKSLRPRVFVDPMVGSGTSVEVAREMGIEAYGLDLHSGFDALTMSIQEAVGKQGDLVVSHPPYGGMIRYSGPGGMWGDKPHPSDLSHCVDDEDFHQKLQRVLLNQRDATLPGGVYGSIIGDWRRNGVYTSYQAELLCRMPKSELSAVIIKAQHNCQSDAKRYGQMRFPFVLHEYLILWTKPKTVMSALGTLVTLANEQAQRLQGTWKAVIHNALVALGGTAPLAKIYDYMAKHVSERLAQAEHWKAKVRQVLQTYPEFKPIDRGVWGLA